MLELLIVQPTAFCNLDCSYCYLPDRRNKRKMSLDTLDKIFEKSLKSKHIGDSLTIVYHAGEPMVMPLDFYKEAQNIAEKYNKNNIEIRHSIVTNGTLLNQEWCDFLKENENFKIGVSIDGPSFLNNLNRKTVGGKGAFNRTMKGIELLKENNIDFYTISVLTNEALDYPDEMFDFFNENDIGFAGFNIEEEEGFNETSSMTTSSIGRYKKFLSRFFDVWQKNKSPFMVREISPFLSACSSSANDGASQENEAFKIVTISIDGDISTFSPELVTMSSEKYDNFTFGNILEMELDDIVETSKFKQVKSEIDSGINKCKETCDYFKFCHGGSPSNKMSENGSFDTTETSHCKIGVQAKCDVLLDKFLKEEGKDVPCN